MLHYNRLKIAKPFLLPGGFGTLTRWKCAPLGMRHKKGLTKLLSLNSVRPFCRFHTYDLISAQTYIPSLFLEERHTVFLLPLFFCSAAILFPYTLV